MPQYNKSRSKTLDVLAQDWPFIIQFVEEHNHNVFSATALIRRPICESTKQEILEYFGRGYSVSYNTLLADRHYFQNKTG